jgi:hypothetical protein
LRSAPVAQLDRAPDYESGGRRFESFRARHFGTLQDLRLVDSLIHPACNVRGQCQAKLKLMPPCGRRTLGSSPDALTNTCLACLSFSAATADIPDAGRASTRVIITLGQGDHLVGSTAATALDALICLRSRLNASHGRLRTPPEKHNSTNHIRAPAYISRSVGRLPAPRQSCAVLRQIAI